ncbi:MAG: hypothetical protein JO261_08555 [Alphaproteobacteria bacterium]|nr:hypothetical protein [Alphaproteobacteria bacterium]MBV9693738.1 hypothetical protein [Alphaproteobacteria bacterium]
MMRAVLLALAVCVAQASHASPACDGVERNGGGERALHTLHDEKARALRSFLYDGWEISEIALSGGSRAFVFLSPDKTVAVWRGAWTLDEISQAKEWTVENAPGIPNQLARCFAVQVTREHAP